MRRLILSFRFWSAAQTGARAINRAASLLADGASRVTSYCQKRSTIANLGIASRIASGRR